MWAKKIEKQSGYELWGTEGLLMRRIERFQTQFNSFVILERNDFQDT